MLNGTQKTASKTNTNTIAQKFIKYQVNTLVNTTTAKKVSKAGNCTIKEALGNLLKKYNFNGGINPTTFTPNAIHWITEDDKVTIKDVWDAAQSGFTIRGGIKVGGNSKEHVTESYFLLADIDNADNGKTVSYKESTATKWGVYANFWYASPSFTEDNQKHRLGFQFSRPCTVAEHETIGKFLKDEFLEQEIVIDPSCFDAGRLFYGSARKDVGEFFGYDVLPVDEILELAKAKDENKYFNHSTNKISKRTNHNVISPKAKSEKKEKPEISSDASITDKVLDYFYTEIFINKLNGDVSALYDIYDHKLMQCVPDEADMIDKYEGSNPFSDTNKSGKSFVICCWENQLPAFVDRSKNFTRKKMSNGKFQHGGTFIDYFVFANKKVNDLYPNIKTRNELVGKNFRNVVKDICNYFNVQEFDFRVSSEEKTLDIALKFTEYMKGKMFKFLGNTKTTFFLFSEITQCWELIQNRETFSSLVLTPWLELEYGEDSREYHDVKLGKEIMEYIFCKWRFSFKEMSDKLVNLNYLPMRDGLLDIQSKEFIPNEGQALNRNKSIFSYTKTDDDNVNVKIFKEWMNTWLCGDQEKIDLVISWMSLVCQRQAFKTGSMVGFIGNPGCGKSTIVDFLHGLCEGFASKPDVSTFTDVNNTHGRALIENKNALFFNELTTKSANHSMEIFKSLTGIAGEKKIFLSINPKGENERLIDARCGITFDCQDIPKGLNDGGYDRRAVYLMLTEANKSEKAVELSQSLENFGSQQDIFNWLVGMDVNEMIETFNRIKKSEMVLETTIKVRREEPLSQFVIDTVEVTNEPSDKMACNDLYESYNAYITKSGDYKMSRTKFIKELQKILQSKTHGFNWTGEKKNMKLNSVQVNGLTGLMFKPETTSFDELAEQITL